MYQVELERLKLKQLEEDKQRLQQQVGEPLLLETLHRKVLALTVAWTVVVAAQRFPLEGDFFVCFFKLKPRTMLVYFSYP